MAGYRYVDEIGLTAILATKRLAAVTPEVSLRECVTHMPPQSANKAGFHKKSKTGISVALWKRLVFFKN